MARFFLLALLVALSTQAQAGVLTNGALTVTLRSNGAIDSAVFGKANFFKNGGQDISDFGLQNGTDISTFLVNDTIGNSQLSLVEAGFSYSGSHSWGSNTDFDYLRSYSLIAGLNALRVTTTITNRGLASFTVSHFDTFDPDQGYGALLGPPVPDAFETYNDVFELAGGRVGQASIDRNGSHLTVLVGSFDSRAVIASGAPLQIGDGSDLNGFFQAPTDRNGMLEDEGTHIGFRQFLNVNQSTTFTYIMAFGANPNDAQQAFTLASGPLASVPEPNSLAVFGAMGLSLLLLRRKNAT